MQTLLSNVLFHYYLSHLIHSELFLKITQKLLLLVGCHTKIMITHFGFFLVYNYSLIIKTPLPLKKEMNFDYLY